MRRDVARMQEHLLKTYFELMLRCGRKRITVNDVIKSADISRGTFYAHFRDIEDINEKTENRIVSICGELLTEKPIEEMITAPDSAVTACLDILMNYEEAIKAMHLSSQSPAITGKFKELIRSSILEYTQHRFGLCESEILSTCIASSVVDACIEWIISEERPPRKELTSTVSGFITKGISFFSMQ